MNKIDKILKLVDEYAQLAVDISQSDPLNGVVGKTLELYSKREKIEKYLISNLN